MLNRRLFLGATLAPATVPVATALQSQPVVLEVRNAHGKPTLHRNGAAVPAMFYALTDATGGRFSFDEAPAQSLRQFAALGFQLFQVDLFLADCLTADGRFSLDIARRQLAGVIAACPSAAIVLRWHVNAPAWWCERNAPELVAYANGGMEVPERWLPTRYMQDDLRRTPRASLASVAWMALAERYTRELLAGLARSPEGRHLGGVHIACGVYGEWHYWGFMRNEPDTSAPMQRWFAEWRRRAGKTVVAVPDLAARAALDDQVFRDPVRREAVIDYYRCQQSLVVERFTRLCALAKRSWPRPLLTGVFYGYFFSMFNRQVTGGHLLLHEVLASPHIDYLSAPQAYGEGYREVGGSGITRALVESVRRNGKLFLDEMDQTPSWRWRNDVDVPFELSNVLEDIGILRRNVFEGYCRGAGLWYYDFGPANHAGWWADRRLQAEIAKIKAVVDRYHTRPYEEAADVLAVFDTEVYFHTGSTPGADGVTDPLAVNRTIAEMWRAGASIATVHMKDLKKIDLTRYRCVVFGNTWILDAATRALITEQVQPGRTVVFQGWHGYGDGERLGLPLPVGGERLVYLPKPGVDRKEWRRIFEAAGVHCYAPVGDVVHAGGGVVLVHTAQPGVRDVHFRNGKRVSADMKRAESWLWDAATGERLL
jgi:hypothetical protein